MFCNDITDFRQNDFHFGQQMSNRIWIWAEFLPIQAVVVLKLSNQRIHIEIINPPDSIDPYIPGCSVRFIGVVGIRGCICQQPIQAEE